MLKWNQGIVVIALSLYIVVILKLYLDIFLVRRQSWLRTIGWLPFFVWQCIINGSQADIFPATLNLLISLSSILLTGVLVYEGSLWKRCMFPLFFSAYWMLLEGIVYSTAGILLKNEGDFFLLSMIPQLFLLFTVIGIRCFFKKKGDVRMPYGAGGHLILIPIEQTILYSGFYILISEKGFHMPQAFLWLAVMGVILVIVNLSIYPAYQRILENAQEKENARLYVQQMELYSQQRDMEEAAASEIREMRHDMKQKFLYLRELAEHSGKETFEATLDSMIGETAKAGVLAGNTGNIAVDAQVNHLWKEAETGAIALHTELKILPQMQIKDSDLCVLLGNALDNAVEASLREDAGEIWLTMKLEKGCLLIQVRNRCRERTEEDRKGYLKSKKNGDNHGLGLRSMEKIAKKYHGYLKTEWENGIFTLNALLYEENADYR